MSDIFQNLYILEMANNHQGSVEHGLKIVDAAARIARKRRVRAAVKLQFRDLDTFIHPDFKGRQDVKHIPRFESTKLDTGEFRQLVDAIREAGMVTVATPFDEPSVQTCQALGVEIIKVASCSATDWPLLQAIAETRKPVIASTGGLSIYQIDNLVTFLSKRTPELAILHCVSMYPTPNEQHYLNFMEKMMRRYPYVTVGFSGHEAPDNTEVVRAAVAKGARLLERHFGVPTDEISLNAYSVNPEEADRWVEAAERTRAICGPDRERHVSEAEYESLLQLQRGVFAKRAIKKGEVLGREDVFFAMPCEDGQLTSGQFGQYRTRYTASKDYDANEAVFERPQDDSLRQVRGILHDAKGQLYEAGLILGDEVNIEISHHYGLDRFRETGCILITAIDRDYCNKFLIMLPGQKHPHHMHKKKEESFHLLWGDLDVDLDGDVVRMKPGDKLHVEPGRMHAFRTQRGCVFAEISTRASRGDSYYKDESIASMDPLARKTIVENW